MSPCETQNLVTHAQTQTHAHAHAQIHAQCVEYAFFCEAAMRLFDLLLFGWERTFGLPKLGKKIISFLLR